MARAKKLPPHSVQIRRAREAAGLTFYGAAKAAGISQAAWAAVERGADPKLSTLHQIARAVGVPLRELVDPLPEKREIPCTDVDSTTEAGYSASVGCE